MAVETMNIISTNLSWSSPHNLFTVVLIRSVLIVRLLHSISIHAHFIMSYIYHERFAKLYDQNHLLILDMHDSQGEGTLDVTVKSLAFFKISLMKFIKMTPHKMVP